MRPIPCDNRLPNRLPNHLLFCLPITDNTRNTPDFGHIRGANRSFNRLPNRSLNQLLSNASNTYSSAGFSTGIGLLGSLYVNLTRIVPD